jgi:hypothetical protein
MEIEWYTMVVAVNGAPVRLVTSFGREQEVCCCCDAARDEQLAGRVNITGIIGEQGVQSSYTGCRIDSG